GYGPAGSLFSTSNIGPNITAYGARLFHGEGAALAVAAAALTIHVVRRRPVEAGQRVGPAAMFALLMTVVVVALYLPYAVFAEWSYLRFLLPAFPLLFVLVGAMLVAALLRLPPSIRSTIFLVALTLACSMNVVRALEEQAFNLHRYESRYRIAGRYLDA